MQRFKKKHKRNTLINTAAEFINGWAYMYIQNNIFIGKWMGLYPWGGEGVA